MSVRAVSAFWTAMLMAMVATDTAVVAMVVGSGCTAQQAKTAENAAIKAGAVLCVELPAPEDLLCAKAADMAGALLEKQRKAPWTVPSSSGYTCLPLSIQPSTQQAAPQSQPRSLTTSFDTSQPQEQPPRQLLLHILPDAGQQDSRSPSQSKPQRVQ
jgi:hypothetical protein